MILPLPFQSSTSHQAYNTKHINQEHNQAEQKFNILVTNDIAAMTDMADMADVADMAVMADMATGTLSNLPKRVLNY